MATWNSDGSPASVQALHDQSATHDGDIITLPSGTFSWTTQVNITKGITISGNTTVTGDHTTFAASEPTVADNTVLTCNLSTASMRFFNIDAVPSKPLYRITGLTFTGGPSNIKGLVVVGGSTNDLVGLCHNVRIDHCHVTGNIQASQLFEFYSDIMGVVDHVFCNNTVTPQKLQTRGDTGGYPYGDREWLIAAGYGGPDFMFFEDCYFKNDTGAPFSANYGIDSIRGAKWVMRYSYLYNIEVLCHGMEGDRVRGGRAQEIYNNIYFWDHGTGLDGIRSGTLISHDNTFVGVLPDGYGLQAYRRIFGYNDGIWGGADGFNEWDYNATAADLSHTDGQPGFVFETGTVTAFTQGNPMLMVDNTKNWSLNRWRNYEVSNVRNGDTWLISANTGNSLSGNHWGDSNDLSAFIVGDTYRIGYVLQAMDQPTSGFCADDIVDATTTITSAITLPTPTVPVVSTAGFPSRGRVRIADSRVFKFASKTATSLNGCTGGTGSYGVGTQVTTNKNATTGEQTWPRQIREGCYAWNNIHTASGSHVNFRPTSPELVEGRDYFSDTVKPGYTPYTYPHPLVGSAGPTGKIISLTGTGLNFGNVFIGQSSTGTLTVSNTGDTTLTVTAVSYPSGFSGATAGFTVAAGAHRDITVTFTPLLAQAYAGNITVTSDATSGSGIISVSGTGLDPAPGIHGHRRQVRESFSM